MMHTPARMTSRREFLACSTAAAAASVMGHRLVAAGPSRSENQEEGARRPKVAAVFTELRFRSHAYNILQNFLGPYLFRGKLVDPGVEVVSFYADQFPAGDMARRVAERFDIRLFDSIQKAVCLGGSELAVDAVLSIGEHGDYPYNALGQKMYPRKRFFDEITAPMKRSNRFVPIFNDKHLSYRWDWAKAMYDEARAHGIPFLAGSSVPLAQRIPPLELPKEAEIVEAVSIHGGGFETYDFHGLELLQSFVEARKGGESGVSRVELLHGEKLKRAISSGRLSQELIDAAMQAERDARMPRQPRPKALRQERAAQAPSQSPPRPRGQHAIEVTYKDGFRATVITVGSSADRWNFACRLKGDKKPRATALYNGPWGNRCLFRALSHAIQYLFRTRKQPYPIERTLLVTGVLEAAVRSFAQARPIETPHLEFGYRPLDFDRFREDGKSWEIITADVPQPVEFTPGYDAQVFNAHRTK